MARKILVAMAAAFGLSLVVALPALAGITQDTGLGCFGTARVTLEDGTEKAYDTTTKELVVVPREDAVQWTGELRDLPPPSEGQKHTYSGKIELKLPPPLPPFEIDSWDGDTDKVANGDTYDLDLPSWIPGGAEVTVEGFHEQNGKRCDGSYAGEIEGGAGAVAVASSVITAGAAAATVLSGRPKN